MHLKIASRVLLVWPVVLSATIVGTNPPSLPLTAERIAELPPAAQPAWRDYLAPSVALRAATPQFLADEIKAHEIKAPVPVAQNRANPRVRGNRSPECY